MKGKCVSVGHISHIRRGIYSWPERPKLIDGRRKTAFIGFLANIKSIRNIFDNYVAPENALKYILTYKMSQDHLELFFCAIRALGRGNNNPSAQQFSSAYKRLLTHHAIKATGGNCSLLDSTHFLLAVHDQPYQFSRPLSISDVTLARKYNLDLLADTISQSQEDTGPFLQHLKQSHSSGFREAVLSYMAGFVVRMLKRHVTCTTCS